MTSESGNPSSWAKLQEVVRSGVTLNDYLDIYQGGAVDHYLKMHEAGASVGGAMRIASGLAKLKPEAGKDTVSMLQRFDTIIAAGVTEEDQKATFGAVAQEFTAYKLSLAYKHGVTPEGYMEFLLILPGYDLDVAGGYSLTEVTRALNSMSTSSNAKTAL